MAKGRMPTLNEVEETRSGSDTTTILMKTRRGVVRGRTPKERGGGGAGGRTPSFTQTRADPEHPASKQECEEKGGPASPRAGRAPRLCEVRESQSCCS